MREACTGEGLRVDDTRLQWGNTVCPVCHAIANVDGEARVEAHTVLVIVGDDDEGGEPDAA